MSLKQDVQSGFVSIVMPTFNQDRFIGTAIESVLAQNYRHWELIIVNNFSTDRTREVVASFKDSRITLIDFANGGIIARSRNLAITKANGEFLAFLDSDDYWEANKLSRCLDALKTNVDLVCHGEYFFLDGDSKMKPTTYGPQHLCTFEKLMTTGNHLSTSAIVMRRGLLEKSGFFDETKELNTSEDFDLWIRLIHGGAKVAILNDMLGYYRLHPSSASASQVKNARATLCVLEKNAKLGNLNLFDRWRAFLYRARIRFFLRRNFYTK